MLEPVELTLSSETGQAASPDKSAADLDAESLFSAEIAGEALLTRDDEAALAKRIVRARQRVRAVLRLSFRGVTHFVRARYRQIANADNSP